MVKRAFLHYSFLFVCAVAGCAQSGQAPGGPAGDSDAGGGSPDLAAGGGGSPDLSSGGSQGDFAPSASQDLTGPGAAPGEACAADRDCSSSKCIDVYQGNKYCGAGCKAQADCAGYLNMFCEPGSAGSADGFCVPRHPAHCASCDKDSDCGSLSERCIQAPGDIATACHIDCAIAGADACPGDYSCTAVPDGNIMRKLCIPKSGICLDAVGGFCDRVALPQSCARANMAGVCTGQRPCLNPAHRYDKCGAMAPQFKANCQAQDPAGCMLSVDPNSLTTKQNCGKCGVACGGGQDCCASACTAITTIQNCGACGKVCPGQTNTSDAVCTNMACDMTCRGDNYDVDKSLANGCEVLDIVPPGHTQQAALDRGHKSCDDNASRDTVRANLPSDARVHTMSDGTISGVVGAAPDYIIVHADGGGGCVSDYLFQLTTMGGGNVPCYTATMVTDKTTDHVTVSGNGFAEASGGSFGGGQYSDGSIIVFTVKKTCNLPVQESVSYTLYYHL